MVIFLWVGVVNLRALVGVFRVGVEKAEAGLRFLEGVRGVLDRRLKLASAPSKSSASSPSCSSSSVSSGMGETERSCSQSESGSSSEPEFFLRRFRRVSGFPGTGGAAVLPPLLRVSLVPFRTSSPTRKMLVSRPL